MHMPKPYFKHIPSVGDLELDEILLEDGYPVLFTCKGNGRQFICLCRSIVKQQTWFVYETNEQILKEFKNGTIDLKQAIKAYPAGTSVVVLWDKEIIKENYRVFVNVAHDVDSLPDNFFLEKEDEEQ